MTRVPEQREASEHDSPRPSYGAQPAHARRPVPLRHSHEAPKDPAEWDSSSIEPSQPRGTDDIKDAQRRAERETRSDLAAASDVTDGADSERDQRNQRNDDESSYSSELEQGAAQPGTDEGKGGS